MNRKTVLALLAIGMPGLVFSATKPAQATGNPSQTYCTNSQLTCNDLVTGAFGAGEINYRVAQTGNPVIGTETGAYGADFPSGDYYYLEAATLCGSSWKYSGVAGPYFIKQFGQAGVFCPNGGQSSEGWAEYALY